MKAKKSDDSYSPALPSVASLLQGPAAATEVADRYGYVWAASVVVIRIRELDDRPLPFLLRPCGCSAGARDGSSAYAAATKKVSSKEGTVDNEFLGRKSSKMCRIFHKEMPFEEDCSNNEAGNGDEETSAARVAALPLPWP
ncbi:hypothetical protein VPH35_035228 [Triticum aestivum]|uniref:Uncharacterized protein n=1 Tax=Aegilops tauschii TaxID=37682 RepID=R7WG13_AEGTA